MTEQELAQNLKRLQAIIPRKDFVLTSRSEILSLPKRKWAVFGIPQNILYQSLNFAFSTTLAALFIILIAGGFAGSLKNALLAKLLGIDTELIAESKAVTKDIDIHLQEAEYLAVLAEKTRVALKEVSANGPGHLNPVIIQNEAHELRFNDPTENEIDELLDKAI